MDLFNSLKEKYKQLMTVNVPQTLGQIASNPGLNRFAQRWQDSKKTLTPFSPLSLQKGVESARYLSAVTRQAANRPTTNAIAKPVLGATSKLLNVASYPIQLSQMGSQNISTGTRDVFKGDIAGGLGKVGLGAGQFMGGAGSLYYGGKLLTSGGLKGITSRAIQGTGIGLGMGTGSQLLTGGGIPTKQQALQYAQGGLENSWTLAITNALTDKVLGTIAPNLVGNALTQPFTQGAVKEGFKRVFTRALAEVPAENTAFTWLDRLDGESQRKFMEDWMLNLPGNIATNLAFAGIQGTWNTAINKESRSAVNSALEETFRKWNTKVTTMKLDKDGKRVSMPMWKYQMMKNQPGLTTKDINELSVEDYQKIKPTQASKGVETSIQKAQAIRKENLMKRTHESGKSVAEWIENRIKGGSKVEAKEVVDKSVIKKLEQEYQSLRRQGYGLGNMNFPQNQRVQELRKILQNPEQFAKTEYRLIDPKGIITDISKTEYEYAQGLNLPTQASKGVEVSSRKEIRTNLVKTPVVQKGTKVSSMQSPRELATRTKATSEVSSTPIVTEKGKLNINRLNVEGEGKKVLQAQEAQVKPTVISNKEVVKTARTANATKTMTDEQMKTLMSRQLKNRQQVVDLTKKFNQLKSEGASEQELAKVMLDLADQSRTARQGGTFAGRLLQAQNIVADKSASPMQRVLALLDNAGVKEEKYLKDSVKVDWNNPKEVVGFYRKYVPPSFGEVLDEVRYTNMLSSPLTHIINLTSNALQTGVVAPVEKTLSGTIDFGKSLLTGKERKYYTTAGIDYAGGYVKALPEAFKKAWNVISGKEISVRPDFEYVPTSVGGPLKAYTLPLRMLEAGDQFFRTLVKGGVTSELGKGPRKLSVTQIADVADKESTYRLFRQAFDPSGELGQGVVLQMFDKWNSAISNMRRLPGGKWILPFLQTPTNILKQGVEYSPLGITTMAGAKNPVEQLSKTMIGSAVFLGAYELAKNGLVSWAAPSGDTERSLYYDAGLQPYSVKFGDKWVSFSKLGPLSYPIAMAAAMSEAERNNPDKTKIENISKSISGMLGFFGDQSYVRSIGDLVDAIQGGVNVGPTAISSEAANLLGQLIPYKSFQTWLGRIIDPTYRKANTFGEKMIKDLPIIGENLEPYTNLEGEPSMRDYPLLNALSPYKVSEEKQSVGMYEDYKTKKIQNAIEKRADEAFLQGKGLAQVGDIRRYIDEDGKVQKIDLSFPMPEYKTTGSETLDKELLSDYKGDLTKLKNSVIEAWEQGFITQEEAEANLKKIESAKVSVGSKKTKKFTFKKVTMPKIKTTKTKKITVKRPTKSVKSLRAQKIKITVPKINVKGKV